MRGRAAFAGILRRFTASVKGAMALEFAFGLPIAVFAVLALVELSMLILVNTLVEGGLREASRFGITGQVPNGVSREEVIKDLVGENTLGLVDMSKTAVTTKTYSSFAEVGRPEPFGDGNDNDVCDAGESYTDVNGNGAWDDDMGADGAGGPGDVVLYTISFEWDFLTPIPGQVFGQDGTIPMNASVVVRNEPWDAPTTTTPETKTCD